MVAREFTVSMQSRGIDCGADRWVTLPAAMSAMEAGRWVWLSDPTLGLLDDLHQGHGFIVAEQQIAFKRRFGVGVPYHCTAELYQMGRVEAYAYQQLRDSRGELLAHTQVRGAWINAEGRLTRIPRVLRDVVKDQKSRVNHPSTPPAQISQAHQEDPLKSSLLTPPSPLRRGSLTWNQALVPSLISHHQIHTSSVQVRDSDCDLFNHVNASVYLRYIADALSLQNSSSSLDRAWVRYEGQAHRHDLLKVHTLDLGQGQWAAEIFRDSERLISALVEVENDTST